MLLRQLTGIVLGVGLLAACGSTAPSRFYVLARVHGSPDLAELQGGPQVRLGPVELPKILLRPEIVTRSGEHRIVAAEYDRWAGDLQEMFKATLALNLAVLLPSEHVVRFTWEELENADHFLTVSVGEFEAVDGKAVLTARWGIAARAGRPAVMHLSRYEAPIAGAADDYPAIVAALSQALADLSREIAEAVRAEEQGG